MTIGKLTNAANANVTSKPPTTATTPTTSGSTQSSTPAATVEFSDQALAASNTSKQTSPAPSGAVPTTSTSAPKVNQAKLAAKEANEPQFVLQRQAKQGDVVAKQILKQLAKKQAEEQSASGPTETAEGQDVQQH